MKKWLVGLALLSSITTVAGYKHFHTQELCHGFLPENHLHIPVRRIQVGGITQAEFNAVMDRIQKLYGQEIQNLGGELSIDRAWDDDTVNASADRSGSTWFIHMYGGLARHPDTTIEGMALVACHELGHHLGGAPRFATSSWSPVDMSWGSVEGEADYFGALKCLRKFFAEDDNAAILSQKQIDPAATKACNEQFTDKQDVLLCLRSSLASQSVVKLMYDAMGSSDAFPSYSTPDSTVVSSTMEDHPPLQCRLDTYLAAMSCTVKVSESMGNDEKQGACYAPRDKIGFRPSCWYVAAR